MTLEIEIEFAGDHVRVRSNGEKDFEAATSVWTQVAAVCEEHQCFKVLGIADSAVPLEVFDAYDHARLFESLGIDDRYRIAWVELNTGTGSPGWNSIRRRPTLLPSLKLFWSIEDCRADSFRQSRKPWDGSWTSQTHKAGAPTKPLSYKR